MSQNGCGVVKAVLYARCSTDEARQDVEVQLVELRRYAQAFGWSVDEVSEYDSGFKGTQPKLKTILEAVRRQQYQVFVCHSLDRFSRRSPHEVNAMIERMVHRDGCRFVSLVDRIDSADEISWHITRHVMQWMANRYSLMLSEKIRSGIAHKRGQGVYRGGRPKKMVDADRLRGLLLKRDGLGWRRLTTIYNQGLRSDQQVSFSLLRRIAKHLQFNGHQPTDGAVSITPASH